MDSVSECLGYLTRHPGIKGYQSQMARRFTYYWCLAYDKARPKPENKEIYILVSISVTREKITFHVAEEDSFTSKFLKN